MLAKEQVEGVVENKKSLESRNPKAPNGSFYINGKKLTVWDEELWESIEENKEYSFLCNVKQNEYQGKTYTNYNVSACIPVEGEVLEKCETLSALLNYEVVIDNSIKQIKLPQGVVDFLKENLE